MSDRMLLEIGGGASPLDSRWKKLDYERREGDNVDYVAAWSKEPGCLPFEDNTWDYVYAAHVLEHLPFYDGVPAMKEILRILKPGGEAEIHVPDFEMLVKRWYLKKDQNPWYKAHCMPNRDYMEWLNTRIYGYNLGVIDPWHQHLAMYDAGFLQRTFERAGFVEVRRIGEPRGHEKHEGLNLGMRGKKP